MDIRYYLVKNGTDTAAKAPYTIRVVPNGVANLNDLVTEILARISSSEQRVRMVITEATKVMLRHVLAGETVDFGGIRFKAQIPGSMDYEDSPFRPGVDEVIVCAYVDDELRDTFDGIVPVKISAEEVAASIRVSNVMDIATESFGEIHGTAPFKVLGNGITLDAEGESAKLLDRRTGEVLETAEVETVSKGQRATCAFAAVPGGITKGAYVLEVTTFGLVGETTPRVFRKPVTLVEAIPAPAKPKVTATELKVIKTSVDTAYDIFGLENVEAIKGYSEGEPPRFDAKISINGEEPFEDSFNFLGGTERKASITNLHGDVGDRVTLTLEVDPSKTEYDQTPCVLEATIVAE